jgi:hypothetical protein
MNSDWEKPAAFPSRLSRALGEEESLIRDYSTEIDLYWPTIERAWNDHADKHPIIECDLAKRRVYAYTAKEYIAGLSDRTREDTEQRYERTVRDGSMMVFIRDSDNRVLQSYVFSRARKGKKGSPIG